LCALTLLQYARNTAIITGDSEQVYLYSQLTLQYGWCTRFGTGLRKQASTHDRLTSYLEACPTCV
jgi:hypothetical protein